MAQFSHAENKILDMISLSALITILDFQEFIIIKLILDGYNMKEIAATLHVSYRYLNRLNIGIAKKIGTYLDN